MNTKRWGLFLEPLDVLFFRDGRPFGPATRGQSGLPAPQTLAGAVTTALLDAGGVDFTRLAAALRTAASFADALEALDQPRWIAAASVRGPWLALNDAATGVGDVFVAAPEVLRRHRHPAGNEAPPHDQATDSLMRLRPLRDGQLPGWQPPRPGLRPLWCPHSGRLETVGGFLNHHGLQAFLAGEPVVDAHVVRADSLFASDQRTGIAIEPHRLVADQGQIYAANFLALRPGVGFYAEVLLPDEVDLRDALSLPTLAFGGEGRRVRVQVLDRPWAWPEALPNGARQKPLAMLTTPGLFAPRWYPTAFTERLIAAAVPGDVPVSGWDLARGGPKRTRFAARPGSVYFLDEPLADWPAALSDDPFDCQQGWGCYLRGVWTDE